MVRRCIIYAFSGTGNSLIVANFIAAYLNGYGIDSHVFRVRYPLGEIPDPNDYDYVGFTYPIHGFNTPRPFLRFVKLLPKSGYQGKPFFIAKDSGEPFAVNSASSSSFVRIMRKKGYRPTLEHHYLMPYNIMFAYDENLRKQMYLYTEALTRVLADDIASGKVDRIKYKWYYRLCSALVRIEHIAGPVNSKLTYVKKSKCIHCDLCIRGCPVHAVYRNKRDKIKIRPSCFICMACSFNCPVDAFRMGFLNPWRVNFGGFQYERLLKDDRYDGKYVNRNTKGYFRHFRKYYREQDRILLERGYKLPVDYNGKDSLEA